MTGPRLPLIAVLKRITQRRRDALGLVNVPGHVRHRLEHSHQVERLIAVAVDEVALGIAGDDNQGRASLVSQGDARQQVNGAGTGCSQADSGFPGCPRVAVSHQCGILLVTRIEEADVRPAEQLGNDVIRSGPTNAENVTRHLPRAALRALPRRLSFLPWFSP